MYLTKPDVIETDLTDELILLDPTTQEMFSLNESGRVVWRALRRQSDQKGIIEALTERFPVSFEQAESELGALIAALLEADLIRQRDGEDAD